MTNVYVMRDGNGKVSGVVARPQIGWDLEAIPDDAPEVVAFLHPSINSSYRISKMTPWLRMTDAEAETMTSVMNTAPARLRAIYNAAPYLQSDDPFWPTLHEMLSAALSPQRADQLLAPET